MTALLAKELPKYPDPLDKILLILEANLGQKMFLASNAPAWMSFLARVRHNPEFARMYKLLYKRFNSNLKPLLIQFVEDEEAKQAVEDLYAVLDGYWVRLTTMPESVTSEIAMSGAIRSLDRIFCGKFQRRFVQEFQDT